MSRAGVRVALEEGRRRTFATALDWPGWCRSGRGEIGAIEALVACAARYAAVVEATGGLPPPAGPVVVVERLSGGAGTDFGAPEVPAADESRPTTAQEGERLAAILAACWRALDRIAEAAPQALRKGPRGGGRDRSQTLGHVLEAERGHYARKLGVRRRPFGPEDRAAREELRSAVLAVLRVPSDGSPVVAGGWSVRFAARKMAWHVLDHAWEIEDRSGPERRAFSTVP